MVRPFRIEYPGALYHVMNRGAARQNIFQSVDDYNLFLDLLNIVTQKYSVEIHAYCLMTNHYHLLICTLQPNLNKAMKFINGVFTQKVNKRYKKDGPLFRGRYKSILVEEESYFLVLSRYIHMNPVAAGIVKKPEDYKWSSYKDIISERKRISWLCHNKTLKYFDNNVLNYKLFVENVTGEDINHVFEMKRMPAILGKSEFIELIKEVYKPEPRSLNELPQYSDLLKLNNASISEILKVISEIYELNKQEIFSRKTFLFEKYLFRDIAIYLATTISACSQKEIASKFGKISYARVSQIFHKMLCRIETDFELKKEIIQIEEKIINYLKLKI